LKIELLASLETVGDRFAIDNMVSNEMGQGTRESFVHPEGASCSPEMGVRMCRTIRTVEGQTGEYEMNDWIVIVR
jgi:hypothetical protein